MDKYMIPDGGGRKMEMEKRKRQGNEEADERRTRAKDDEEKGEQRTATEDEVEEFFAIIRRMHDVVRYFEKGKGEGSKVGEKGSRWKPVFEWEDFDEVNGIKVREKREEAVEENNLGLDLNADPESGTEKIIV